MQWLLDKHCGELLPGLFSQPNWGFWCLLLVLLSVLPHWELSPSLISTTTGQSDGQVKLLNWLQPCSETILSQGSVCTWPLWLDAQHSHVYLKKGSGQQRHLPRKIRSENRAPSITKTLVISLMAREKPRIDSHISDCSDICAVTATDERPIKSQLINISHQEILREFYFSLFDVKWNDVGCMVTSWLGEID